MTNNATLAFNRADAFTVANAISGSGTISILGAGATTLAGVNTFSGGTTVGVGATLAISSSAALGSGFLALAGGPTVPASLKVTADTLIANPISVAGDPVFDIAPGATATIAKPITDGAASGEVVVQGGGALALTAANTYTGPTKVMAGSTLALRGSASIASSANVVNEGALDLRGLTGGAVLGGGFAQSSTGTLFMRMSAAGPQSLTIAGSAALAGVLNITAAPGAYKSGVYRVLTAGGVTGAFSGLSTNLGAFARLYSLSYQGGAVDLTVVVGPDAANTKRALAANSSALGAALSQRTAMLAGALDYDCPAFNDYGACIAFQARYGAMEAWSDGAGVLTAAARLSPQLRLGGFIDQAAMRNGPAGVKVEPQRPAFGAFLGFSQTPDGLGLQAKLSGAYKADAVTATRDKTLPDTEAGSGKARLDGYAVGAELGYGLAWTDGLTATPFVGVRYAQAMRAAYEERARTGAVDYPIAYEAFSQRLGTATAGLRLNGWVGEHVGYHLGAGIDHHFYSDRSDYAGASEIYGLEAFALPGAVKARRMSPFATAALSYQINRMQALTANVTIRGQAYSSQPSVSLMTGYRAAF